MKWERRKITASAKPEIKTTDLPYDYLKLVEQTLNQAMLKGLEEIRKIHPDSAFQVNGALFSDEVLITVTLSHGEKNIAATTVHASADFNPDHTLISSNPIGLDDHPGSTPLERVLGACVDAATTVFDFYLDPSDPEKIVQLANHSLGSLEEAPFEWTIIEKTDPKVWVKMDKSNPKLEKLADEWLNRHDPDFKENEEEEEFLSERLEAIRKARDGDGQNGPIRH